MDLNIQDLELDDVEDKDIDVDDLDGFGEVDMSVEEKHIRVDTKEFKNFLSVAKNIASATGRDVVTKSICMKVFDDKLRLLTTDLDVYLEYDIDLINEENILKDEIVIPLEVLEKLIKAVPSNIIIYKEEGDYLIKLLGGDMVLETYNVDLDRFKFTDKVKKDSIIDIESFFEVIDNFNYVVSSAVSSMERRIMCSENGAYASYMWAVIKSSESFADMDIKIKDIKVLKKLLDGREGNVEVFDTVDAKVNRKVLEGDNFSYAFLVSSIDIPDGIKEDIENIVEDEGIYIDYESLYKIIELADELPYSMGKINVNFLDNKLKIIIKTKSNKDAKFTLPGAVAGELENLNDDLVLQANLFKILLKSFSQFSSVKISLSDKGLGLDTDKFSAALSSEI